MPIPLSVESPDQAPESLREAYVERDGRWVLDIDEAEDVERLKGALQKERQLHREAAKRAAALERELESVRPKDDDPRVQALRQQIEEYERRLRETEEIMTRRDAENELRQTALSAGVEPRHLPHLMKLLEGRWERRADGFVFLDEAGRPVADDAPAFFARRLAKEFPFFYGRPAAGSGAPHTTGGGGALTREQVEKMTPDEIRARWTEVKRALGG